SPRGNKDKGLGQILLAISGAQVLWNGRVPALPLHGAQGGGRDLECLPWPQPGHDSHPAVVPASVEARFPAVKERLFAPRHNHVERFANFETKETWRCHA